jgi:hypothetical protein
MLKNILSSSQYTLLIALLAGIGLAASACGPAIAIEMVDPLISATISEDLQLSNCDCNTELISTVNIEKELEIGDYAESNSQTKRILIPIKTRAELEAELEGLYRPVFEAAQAKSGQIQLTVPPDMIRSYKVNWETHSYQSSITFRIGLKRYVTSYTYELHIPTAGDFIEIPCTP